MHFIFALPLLSLATPLPQLLKKVLMNLNIPIYSKHLSLQHWTFVETVLDATSPQVHIWYDKVMKALDECPVKDNERVKVLVDDSINKLDKYCESMATTFYKSEQVDTLMEEKAVKLLETLRDALKWLDAENVEWPVTWEVMWFRMQVESELIENGDTQMVVKFYEMAEMYRNVNDNPQKQMATGFKVLEALINRYLSRARYNNLIELNKAEVSVLEQINRLKEIAEKLK